MLRDEIKVLMDALGKINPRATHQRIHTLCRDIVLQRVEKEKTLSQKEESRK